MTSIYSDSSTWRLKTTGANQVPYRIIAVSGGFAPEHAAAQMTLLVPSNRVIDFATEMFPPMRITPTGILYYPPRGRIQGTPLQAKSINWNAHVDGKPVDPFSIDPTAPPETYQDVCTVQVDFETINNEGGDGEDGTDDPETYLTITCNGAGEYIQSFESGEPIPSDDSSSSSSGVDNYGNAINPGSQTQTEFEQIPVSIMVPQFEWNAKWPRVPIDYFKSRIRPRLRAAIGRVNSAAMPLLGVIEPETVLFVGFSSSADFSWRVPSSEFIQIDLKFLEKNGGIKNGEVIGHNHFWKPGDGWERVLYNKVDPVYPSYDLNLIYT